MVRWSVGLISDQKLKREARGSESEHTSVSKWARINFLPIGLPVQGQRSWKVNIGGKTGNRPKREKTKKKKYSNANRCLVCLSFSFELILINLTGTLISLAAGDKYSANVKDVSDAIF